MRGAKPGQILQLYKFSYFQGMHKRRFVVKSTSSDSAPLHILPPHLCGFPDLSAGGSSF